MIRHFSIVALAAVLVSPVAVGQKYEIVAQREKNKSGGMLSFKVDGKESFSVRFYERKPIPAGTYSGCSTTIMATKKAKSVFIPGVKGRKGIFVHPGTKPEHSDGCLVIPSKKMDLIYKTVPRDKKNVTVVVKDAPADK